MWRYICTALCVVLLSLTHVHAQKFWLVTYEFPHGPKTCIAGKGDSFLVVGLANGIMISYNQGNSFTRTLDSPYIHSLHVTRTGKILAGARGKIYRSDLGTTWDSTGLNNNYPVTEFTETDSGIFAITGELTIADGFVGAGVFYSKDDGVTWTARNNGLGIYLSCQRIAHDKNNRLYLGCADEYVTGNSGLFISENNGLSWQHIPITFDGEGVVPDNIKLETVTGINVSPDDSVYISFTGTAVNVSVRLNLFKHINDVKSNSFWNRRKVFSIVVNWWNDRILNKIHFAKNGDWYSSNNGSINTGGTYFSKDNGNNWNWHDEGLGLTEFADRRQQLFTENPQGKIFMVQYFDERIYWQDTSLLIPNALPVNNALPDMLIQPNLIHAGGHVALYFTHAATRTITITDLSGRVINTELITDANYRMQMPVTAGLYFVTVAQEASTITHKVFVNP